MDLNINIKEVKSSFEILIIYYLFNIFFITNINIIKRY